MSGEGLDCVTDTVPEPLNAVVEAFAHRTRGRAVAGSIGGVPAEQSGRALVAVGQILRSIVGRHVLIGALVGIFGDRILGDVTATALAPTRAIPAVMYGRRPVRMVAPS
jgi:hypothetical protein